MRFPWLQVDLDFITAHSRDLGALLGVSRREAMGLAMDLWTWVLGRSTSTAPPDGMVRGPTAARLLAGAVDWDGDPAALLDALVGAGLVERIGDAVRVRGLSRYRSTWEKNQRRNGTGPAPENNRSGTAPEPTRKTQTQTQTQTQEAEDLPAPSSPAPRNELRLEQVSPKRPRQKRKDGAAPDPRHAPLSKALVGAGWPHHGGRTAKAISELLGLAERSGHSGAAAIGEVQRRAMLAQAHTAWPTVRELHELPDKWGHFDPTTYRPPRHAGPAPPSDFSRPIPPPVRSEFAPEVSDEPF